MRVAALILSLTTACATVSTTPVDPVVVPIEEVSVEVPLPLKAGEPAPGAGVWMSPALAAVKAHNGVLWEKAATECLEWQREQPNRLDPLLVGIIGVVAVGAAAGGGYYLGRISK
jgi:hypothetical protein